MSKILIIENGKNFCKECASSLRARGYQIVLSDDVMEALREVSVFGVSLILWDAQHKDPAKSRKLKAIKRYHRYTPLLVMDDDNSTYKDDMDSYTILLKTDKTVNDVVSEILTRVGPPPVFSKKDDYETEEYELTE